MTRTETQNHRVFGKRISVRLMLTEARFDDRDRVVAMWRRNGIQCFQAAPGDF